MPGRAIALVVVLAACGNRPPVPVGEPVPGRGVAYSMASPTAELGRRAADFAGSCAFARPPGDAVRYDKPMRVVAAGAPVYSSAAFGGTENRIGVLAATTAVAAQGPLAGGRDSGAGFAVVVRDPEGRVCRGYVEAGALERPR